MSIKTYKSYEDLPVKEWGRVEGFGEANYVFKLDGTSNTDSDIQLFIGDDDASGKWIMYAAESFDAVPVPDGLTEEEMLAWALVAGQM